MRTRKPKRDADNGSQPKRRNHGRNGGFSLIEVTMAMGIVATVMVPLLALLPYSMTSMREAVDVSTASRILEQVTSDAQLTNYDQLRRLDGVEKYYDEQGTDITARGGKGSFEHVYTARISVPSSNSRSAVRLPGSTGSGISNYVRKVIVEVAITRGETFDFGAEENQREIQRFTTFVSRLRDTATSPISGQ